MENEAQKENSVTQEPAKGATESDSSVLPPGDSGAPAASSALPSHGSGDNTPEGAKDPSTTPPSPREGGESTKAEPPASGSPSHPKESSVTQDSVKGAMESDVSIPSPADGGTPPASSVLQPSASGNNASEGARRPSTTPSRRGSGEIIEAETPASGPPDHPPSPYLSKVKSFIEAAAVAVAVFLAVATWRQADATHEQADLTRQIIDVSKKSLEQQDKTTDQFGKALVQFNKELEILRKIEGSTRKQANAVTLGLGKPPEVLSVKENCQIKKEGEEKYILQTLQGCDYLWVVVYNPGKLALTANVKLSFPTLGGLTCQGHPLTIDPEDKIEFPVDVPLCLQGKKQAVNGLEFIVSAFKANSSN
jgi:hypothetical protein